MLDMDNLCQCESEIHDEGNGCKNNAMVRISEAYIICTECASTMRDIGLYAVTDAGEYAGMAWHAVKEQEQEVTVYWLDDSGAIPAGLSEDLSGWWWGVGMDGLNSYCNGPFATKEEAIADAKETN